MCEFSQIFTQTVVTICRAVVDKWNLMGRLIYIYLYICIYICVCVCRVDTAGKVLALHRCRLRLSRSSAENPEFTLSSITIVRASKSRTGVQVSFMRGTKNVMRTSPVNNKKPSFWGMVLLHDHFFLSGELPVRVASYSASAHVEKFSADVAEKYRRTELPPKNSFDGWQLV